MGKKKIILDTNNLVSALGWEGNSREILRRVIDQRYFLIISEKQLSEIINVLDYPKFKFTSDQKRRFLTILKQISTLTQTKTNLDILSDPKDNMLLECSAEAKADYLISGDKHLLSLKKFNKTKIMTAKEFLDER